MTSFFNNYKFVVVGGGTAGWLTALYTKKTIPEAKVTVIESSDIGILGAGEGTTQFFVEFLSMIDISFEEIIREAKGTIKQGIKFTNWNGDNTSYFHPFSNLFEYDHVQQITPFAIKRIADGISLDNSTLSSVASEKNLVCFEKESLANSCGFALHFDARLLAEFLKKTGKERGIEVIDSKITSFSQKENGDIEKINLENNVTVDSDFVFDCSGFHRLIIGKLLKSKWQSYSNGLPVDKAIPFFIPNKSKKIPPYTEAIAMKYGWVWKIPVEGRYGCGYNFDSSFISEDEAKAEIREMFGDVEMPRVFNFKAGAYKEQWKNNCIAIGLSSGFIEPLEATSIWVQCLTLHNLFRILKPGFIYSDEQFYKDTHNSFVEKKTNEVRDFIQLHYITSRTDTPFWKDFKKNNVIYPSVKKFVDCDNFYNLVPHAMEFFPSFNSFFVAAGCNILKRDVLKKFHEQSSVINQELLDSKTIANEIKLFDKSIKQALKEMCMDHSEFLERVKK